MDTARSGIAANLQKDKRASESVEMHSGNCKESYKSQVPIHCSWPLRETGTFSGKQESSNVLPP